MTQDKNTEQFRDALRRAGFSEDAVNTVHVYETPEGFKVTDGKGHRLTGVRRASQFKGILKNRLIRIVSDALKLVEDKVFKLDSDFDLLIDDANVQILRPSGFEVIGNLQAAVQAAAPENIKLIKGDLPFVDFGSIETYASKHPRAARHLASIRTQGEAKDIDKSALKKLCKKTGVKIRDTNGKITIDENSVMGFLEVLDRRRYYLELVKNSSEYFKASSRRKIGSGSER